MRNQTKITEYKPNKEAIKKAIQEEIKDLQGRLEREPDAPIAKWWKQIISEQAKNLAAM
jgi:hypothetical protein